MLRPHPLRREEDPPGLDPSLVNRWIWLLAGIGSLLVVGWIAHHQPGDVSLHFLYLAPTSAIAWATGRWGGMAMAAVAMKTHSLTEMSQVGETAARTEWLLVDVIVLGAGLCLVANLVASLRSHLRAERAAARRDALTGRLNRRAFLEQAQAELVRSIRHDRSVALAFIDLDGFKTINDELGHAVGDQVLQAVGQVLESGTRESDLVARLGGDEFAILFPESGAEAASRSLERLRAALDARMSEERWSVTFSIGAVAGLYPSDRAADLLQAADRLMYQVKRAGKDSLEVEERTRSVGFATDHPKDELTSPGP